MSFTSAVLINVILLGAACLCNAYTTRSRVESLPGLGAPSTAHYSGFVEVNPSLGSHLFYYYVESQGSPSTDPIIWWMNGGPGASSLVGLVAEVGPYILTLNETLMPNPYAWNRNANLLFVEFGEGIGYSFCKHSNSTDAKCKQSDPSCSPCPSSDDQVAAHNVAFLRAFLGNGNDSLFPELQGRELFLAGESYAGVYIPTLAKAIIQSGMGPDVVQLVGTWATDPCMDNKAQFGWLDFGIDFAMQKGVISIATYNQLRGTCTKGRTKVGDHIRRNDTQACRGAWRIYDLATAGIGDAVHAAPPAGLPMYIDPLNAYGPSGGADLEGYLGRGDVRASIHAQLSPNDVYHIELGNNGYSDYTLLYAACNDHAETQTSMIEVYKWLVTAANLGLPAASKLRTMIISSGDIDPVVAMHGTEAAVNSMGFNVLPGAVRRPWFYNDTATELAVLEQKPPAWGQSLHASNAGVQVGGFTVEYDTGSAAKLHFVTVRDSGHMVPQYAPERVAHVIDTLLLGNKALVPALPEGWDTSSDDEFYGPNSGSFTAWVQDAMTVAPTAKGDVKQGMASNSHLA